MTGSAPSIGGTWGSLTSQQQWAVDSRITGLPGLPARLESEPWAGASLRARGKDSHQEGMPEQPSIFEISGSGSSHQATPLRTVQGRGEG